MSIYECKCCNLITKQYANYIRHLKTNKHKKKNEVNQKSTESQPKRTKQSTESQPAEYNLYNTSQSQNKEHICKYCDQRFSFKQSMYLHIKYRCTKNKDEDLKELVRLMNLKLQQKETQLEMQNKQINTQNKQIEKLMSKLEINNSFNTTNIQNITLLAYKDTDVYHLTEKDYMNCIKQVNFCVKKLIEKIHFNPEKPENMNVYISNLKDKYMMMYENDTWTIKNKKEMDDIYYDKEMMIEQWIEEEQHKYPELKEKFLRYINNKENDETLNMIKDEIKLMMYNNKALIEM